jgi:hypothetical protein
MTMTTTRDRLAEVRERTQAARRQRNAAREALDRSTPRTVPVTVTPHTPSMDRPGRHGRDARLLQPDPGRDRGQDPAG